MPDPRHADMTVRSVSVIMATVVGLTFLFGFGNVLDLALRLGVPVWIAPLVAPALDLTVLGLLVATRHLALSGVDPGVLKPARRLLLGASVVTLALNVAEPLIAGHLGRALFDAVGPLLLMGWAEVGPGLLQAINTGTERPGESDVSAQTSILLSMAKPAGEERSDRAPVSEKPGEDELLARARVEDARHWATCRRPISAETLRKRLHVSAARSRTLVALVRSEQQPEVEPYESEPPALSA
ncbi:hypothetical protein [Amycolatopsis pigmentata]|uniref:DUF2637 domain-containing protein n=1 Tax=Amycolatopsis pigmentata TaxID=450801 RepID=A0ABW5FVC1_9PSEU